MKRPSLIAVSLALNVGLLAVAAFVWRPRRIHSITPSTAAALSHRAIRQPSTHSSGAAASAVTIHAGFHWSEVASPDYETYAKNLRAIGCPVRTIADIIGGDVDDEYSRRIQALVAPLSREFWDIVAPPVDQERLKEAIDKLEELKREKEALLEKLKRQWPGAEATRLRDDQWNQMAFLPPEIQDGIQAAHDRTGLLHRELNESGRDLDNATRQERFREIEHERDAEIAALMTPEQLAEYTLRQSPNTNVRYGYYRQEPSPDELAAIVRLKDEADTSRPPRQGQVSPEQQEQWKAAQDQAEKQIRELLGPDRYADYQRANDSRYRITRLVSDRLELPVEASDRLYDLQVSLEAQAAKLRETASTDEAAFTALQEKARAELGQVLDGEAFDFYERHGGGWIGGLTPTKK